MRWLLLFAVGCGAAEGTGTVVYSEAGTGRVIALDVASGDSKVIDPGSFGAVAISSDRQYFAYAGADRVVKVADRNGNITAVPPGGGDCGGVPVWGPNHSVTYCISDQSGGGTVLLPTLGAMPRRVNGGPIAISADGQYFVYRQWAVTDGTSNAGDDVVENADGSEHRVLRASVMDGGFFLFTPDQQHVLTPSAAGILEIAVADGSVSNLGSGAYVDPLPHDPMSNVSPDGELLLFAGTQYVALNISTGERRYIADAPPHCGYAAFADRDHVVCVAHEDTTPPGSDAGMFQESLLVASGSSITTLIAPPGTNMPCTLVAIARTSGYAAAACGGNATLVSLDGTVLASRAAIDVVGLARDESGIVAVAYQGQVFFLSANGDSRQLATAISPFAFNGGDLFSPYVAYAP
ncbi:MAG: hypothetical protein JO257_16395 [Deltaproteobacteria bacterium]|nr:hypothetical protein [Deltaproteobacteria bacterium]